MQILNKSIPNRLIRTVRYCLLFGCGLTLYHHPASAETITVVAPDYWCPYSCKTGQNFDGYTIDILRAIFEPKGYQIIYNNQNYSRALREVKIGQYQVIPAVYPEEARGFILSREPISNARFCFFTKATSHWKYSGLNSLTKQKIGIIQNYSYGELIDNAIKNKYTEFRVHTGESITKRLITEVLSDRFDSFIEDEYLVKYELTRDKTLPIRNAGCERPNRTFIAFSPEFDKSIQYAQIYDQGIKELRASGKLQNILTRYGLKDWDKPKK